MTFLGCVCLSAHASLNWSRGTNHVPHLQTRGGRMPTPLNPAEKALSPDQARSVAWQISKDLYM